MTFRIGQKVVCIDDAEGQLAVLFGLRKGEVYTVVDLHLGMDGTPRLLPDKVKVPSHIGFFAWRFCPLVEKKTDISVFTKLLNPVPAKTPEKV